MTEGNATPSAQFDLSEASAKLWPYTSHKRWVGFGVTIFLVAFGLFFLAIDASAISTRSLSFIKTVDSLIALVIVVGGIGGMIVVLTGLKRGAILLRLDSVGFELIYPDGTSVRTLWTDPKLRFVLMDLSGASPSKLRTGLPYSISVRGVRSLLTEEAYSAMLDQVARRGLVDAVAPGSRWIFSADANPVFHHIHAAIPEAEDRNQVRDHRRTSS